MKPQPLPIDPRETSVFVGIPCGPEIPWQNAESVLHTGIALRALGMHFDIRFVSGVSIVEMARNKVVVEFLKSSCNRLFMIDSDIQWTSGDFMKLLALSTHMEVVCGAYRIKQEERRFILKWDKSRPMTYNEWGCLPIEGIGLGFTVVQRKVIEELVARAPRVKWLFDAEPIPHLFRCGATPQGEFQGEDTHFFNEVRALGYTVNLYPDLDLGHVGAKVYSGSIRDALRPA